MKRLLGIAIAGLLSTCGLGAAELHMEAVSGGPRGQLQVRLAATSEQATGLQFDLEYDTSLFDVEVVAGRSAEMADKVIRTASPEPNRMRVLVFGMNQTVITNGVVAIIRATPVNAEAARVKNPVRIVALAATDRAGKPVEVLSRNAAEPVKPDAAK